MLLKKIKLENIRSYLNHEINFPEGSTLLSGNIGSGKSTILLAIDFALFGLRKGELSGSALLRNGTQNGSVELHFKIENKDIVIKRTLKKDSKSISQAEGFMLIDDAKQILSAQELKQRILELFNYPKELLTKTKSLIYKYTIYTPQEEMKQILLGDKDFRLDTLRKVFGIDKYKRINENLIIYVKYLKDQKKFLKIKTDDLYQKQEEKEKELLKEKEIQSQLTILNSQIINSETQLKEKKQTLETTESKIKELTEIKQRIALNENNLLHFINQKEVNSKKLEEIKIEIQQTKISQEPINLESIRQRIKDKEKDITNIEAKNKNTLFKTHEAEIKITNSENIKTNINKLDHCPTCKQKVTEQHKHKIEEIEDLEIKQYKEILEQENKQKQKNESQVKEIKIEIEELRKKESELTLLKLKVERLEDKNKQLQILTQEQEELKKKIGEINIKKIELNEKLENYKGIEEINKEIKEQLETIQQEHRKLEIQNASLNNEFKNISKNIENLEKEIIEKKQTQNKIIQITKLQDFLEIHFSNLMQTMERQIMLRVHQDFDSLFQKWFSLLINNEQLQIKLDYEFSPQIIQNGHDIEYTNLSGGEKTAAALAYRLSLNQTINKLMSKIKTKDIIILDEPTDGFSAEQIDRMRLVLDELEVKQLIIVSHDAKIESFVDNVIRLNKQEHISSILN
ncbi:MAG: AAA family ATPase [Candidatus Woesearchaeota archaeon]